MHGRRLTLPDPVAMVHSRLEAPPDAVTTVVMASNWPGRNDANPKFECRTCRARCSVVMAMVVTGLCTRLQPAQPSIEVRTVDDACPLVSWQHVKRRLKYRVIHHWRAVLQVYQKLRDITGGLHGYLRGSTASHALFKGGARHPSALALMRFQCSEVHVADLQASAWCARDPESQLSSIRTGQKSHDRWCLVPKAKGHLQLAVEWPIRQPWRSCPLMPGCNTIE